MSCIHTRVLFLIGEEQSALGLLQIGRAAGLVKVIALTVNDDEQGHFLHV